MFLSTINSKVLLLLFAIKVKGVLQFKYLLSSYRIHLNANLYRLGSLAQQAKCNTAVYRIGIRDGGHWGLGVEERQICEANWPGLENVLHAMNPSFERPPLVFEHVIASEAFGTW